jgi:ribosomal-protein-alanine N-acetyltransferase
VGARNLLIGFLKAGVTALPDVRIEGPRTYLRPPRPRDWESWARLRQESRAFLTPWEPTWPNDALSKAAFARRLKRQITEWRRDEGYSLLVFDKSTDAVLGGIGLSNVRRGVAQTASVGYWVGERYARKGFMTEALRAAMGFGFFQLGLHRIEAACLPSNVASKGLLLKAGFTQEGYARAYLRIEGEWQDHLLFAMLREDFEKASSRPAARQVAL